MLPRRIGHHAAHPAGAAARRRLCLGLALAVIGLTPPDPPTPGPHGGRTRVGLSVAAAEPAPASPALEVDEEIDRFDLAPSGRSLRWERRRVVVCHRPGRLGDQFRVHALVESFGWKPREARVTRISAAGGRRTWTLDDYRTEPFLSDGGFISDARLHWLALDPPAAGDTLLFESVDGLEPFLGFPVLELGDASLPPRRRVLEVIVPRALHPRYELYNGAPEPRRSDEGDRVRLRWELGPGTTLPLDSWTPEAVDLLPAVSLGVDQMAWGPCGTWEQVASSYSRELERRVKPPDAGAATEAAGPADEHRMAEFLGEVQRDVRYVGIAVGPGGLIPSGPAEVARRRFGDCKDMALLLRSELRAAGIEAALALVHTNPPAPERIDPLPTLRAFNHAVVYVASDTSGYWLDPTDRFGTPRTPRSDIQGSPALVLSGPHVGYHRIPRTPAADNLSECRLALSPAAEGRWRLEAWLRVTGTLALQLKHRLAEARPIARGDRVPLPPDLLPLPVPQATPDSLDVVAVGTEELRLRGALPCRIQRGDLVGRSLWPLPWPPAPGPLLAIPDRPRTLPIAFTRSRTYADTLVISGGLELFGIPSADRWVLEGPGISGRGEVSSRGNDLIVTRGVTIAAGWRTAEMQPALLKFVHDLKQHNALPVRAAAN